MISVEQIQKLEAKVLQAVEVIKSLREENSLLKGKLSGYEKRIEELEILIDSFKQDQTNIEEGIINALNQLDLLEDIVSESDSEKSEDLPSDDVDVTGNEPQEEAVSVTEDSEEETGIRIEESPAAENELDIF